MLRCTHISPCSFDRKIKFCWSSPAKSEISKKYNLLSIGEAVFELMLNEKVCQIFHSATGHLMWLSKVSLKLLPLPFTCILCYAFFQKVRNFTCISCICLGLRFSQTTTPLKWIVKRMHMRHFLFCHVRLDKVFFLRTKIVSCFSIKVKLRCFIVMNAQIKFIWWINSLM